MHIDTISLLSTICVFLMVIEYVSQIHKLYKHKAVESMSFTYWGTKISVTVLQFVIIMLNNNPFKVYISQFLSMTGCIIIFTMMYYYSHKNL